MSRLALLLMMMLVTVVPSGYAEPLLSLKAQPAWNGMVSPDATTEITVTLLANHNGAATITLPDHQPRLRITTQLQALQPHTLWLAVRPASGATLTVEARMEGEEAARATLNFTAIPEDVKPVASTLPLEGIPLRLDSGAATLPRTPGGYGTIDTVILDGDTLAALDLRQLASLTEYAAGCGRIVLSGTATPRHEALAAAACGSGFITQVRENEAALLALQQTHRAADPLPSASRLQTLLEQGAPDTSLWRALLLFFILYAAALLLFSRRLRTTAPLLLLPLLATAVGWTAWSSDQVERRLISWSEIDAQGQNARYSTLLQISGSGKGEATTQLPPGLGLLQPQSNDATAELIQQEDYTAAITLKSPSHLLAQQRFFTQGSMALEPPLTLTMTARGPVVENRGAVTSSAALLGWRDQRHPLPPLQPGERWSPPPQGTPWNVARPEEQLLRTRAQGSAAALLLPHRMLPADPEIGEQGWLLISRS